MLTIEQIREAARKVAVNYPVRKVLLFGSYAIGNANEQSDVDILVEFSTNPISLLELAGLNQELRDELKVSVDTIKIPIKGNNVIDLTKAIVLYNRDEKE